ncbi:hypothetical protein [Streptomyces sp. NPDC059564]|uniref:hypothetical protein n=1 Tax=Streptomyces sp. NPDC059564 TaxID=3346865 RepID=UPI00369D7788
MAILKEATRPHALLSLQEPGASLMRHTGMNPRSLRARATLAALVGAFALGGCGQAGQGGIPESGPSSASQPITKATTISADGRTLTTVIPVGGCQKGRLSGTETDTAVSLTLTLTTDEKKGEACTANIRLEPVSFTLEKPLDARKVVDRATGNPLPITQP